MLLAIVILIVSLTSCQGKKTNGNEETQVNKYAVKFVDWNDAVLKDAKMYDEGTAVADIEVPAAPTRAEDAQYTYAFAGWEPALAEVTKNVTYKAKYTATAKITGENTLENAVGNAIGEINNKRNVVDPTLNDPSNKNRLNDLKDEYIEKINDATTEEEIEALVAEFKQKADAIVDEDATPVVAQYEVTFVDWDGTVLKAAKAYDEGTAVADIEVPADPERENDEDYSYAFNGWSPALAEVTEDVTYTAQYTATALVKYYTVTFVDEDGETVLKAAQSYEEGTAVADIEVPADPTKAADANYTYTFSGWTPELAEVTANVTYTAQYTSVAREAGIGDAITSGLNQVNNKATITNRKLAYDETKAMLEDLKDEYIDLINNASTIAAVQDYVDAFKREADALIDVDIANDPDYTVNQKNINLYMNFSNIANTLSEDTPVTSVNQSMFDNYRYDVFAGISGGTVSVTDKALVIGENETLTVDLRTLYNTEHIQINFEAFESDEAANAINVTYYTEYGYQSNSSPFKATWSNYWYVTCDGMSNVDGSHPITITGPCKITTIQQRVEHDNVQVTGKVKYLGSSIVMDPWVEYNENQAQGVTVEQVIDAYLVRLEVNLKNNEDGLVYGAILAYGTQYTVKLYKDGVEVDSNTLLTEADSTSGDTNVYSMVATLTDSSIPSVRSTYDFGTFSLGIRAYHW